MIELCCTSLSTPIHDVPGCRALRQGWHTPCFLTCNRAGGLTGSLRAYPKRSCSPTGTLAPIGTLAPNCAAASHRRSLTPPANAARSRLPRRNAQSPVIQHPIPILEQLPPALPLHLADPPRRVFLPHLLHERLPEHANPVLQPALAFFQHRRPVKERRFPHFQSVPLEHSRIFRHTGVEPRAHFVGRPHFQCRKGFVKPRHQLLDVALAAKLCHKPPAGFQHACHSRDHL